MDRCRASPSSCRNWLAPKGRVASLVALAVVACSGRPETTVDFGVQPSPDGNGMVWSLRFDRDQYHNMLDATPDQGDINERIHHKIQELAKAGLETNGVNCRGDKWIVAKLADGGFAFIGTCPEAHATLADGI